MQNRYAIGVSKGSDSGDYNSFLFPYILLPFSSSSFTTAFLRQTFEKVRRGEVETWRLKESPGGMARNSRAG